MDIEEIRKKVTEMFDTCDKKILVFLSRLNQVKDYSELKKEVLNLNTDYKLSELSFLLLKNLPIKRPVCPTCNIKETRYINFSKGYLTYCSYKCAHKNDNTKNKRKRTNLSRYGVGSPLQNKGILDRVKHTNLEKYGVESPLSNKSVKDKIKQTNLEKYGVENPLQSLIIRNKVKQTNIERHGSEYAFQNENVKNKIKQTNIERYGADNPLQSENIRDKQIKTILNKNYIKLKEKFKDRIDFLFSLEDYLGGKNKLYNFKCVICNSLFEGSLFNGLLPRCPTCYPINVGISNLEKQVSEWLKSWNIDIEEKNRSIINPYELDIYLPDYSIAIEFNGLYWHSELNGKDKNYHTNKTEMCLDKNIQLIHIFEDEWVHKQDIVKSIILSKLGRCERIYARNTIIKEVSIDVGVHFLENNHLQGNNQNAASYFGLYCKDELMQVVGIGRSRYNKNYDYELIRSCTVLNTVVVGGFGKLIKNLPLRGSLISYVDRRYFKGNGYKNWNYIGKSDPNYYYLNTKNYTNKFSRIKFQKHKLKTLFPNLYDESLTEWQIMQLTGYDRIWDCGNLIYSKIL